MKLHEEYEEARDIIWSMTTTATDYIHVISWKQIVQPEYRGAHYITESAVFACDYCGAESLLVSPAFPHKEECVILRARELLAQEV
jgi:hypothetical protein